MSSAAAAGSPPVQYWRALCAMRKRIVVPWQSKLMYLGAK